MCLYEKEHDVYKTVWHNARRQYILAIIVIIVVCETIRKVIKLRQRLVENN